MKISDKMNYVPSIKQNENSKDAAPTFKIKLKTSYECNNGAGLHIAALLINKLLIAFVRVVVITLLLFAVLLLSTDALLVLEVSDLNEWSLIFMRYWLMGLTITMYFFM
jgi:hypothetical protein